MCGPEWSQFMAAGRSARRHIIASSVVAGAYSNRVGDRSALVGYQSPSATATLLAAGFSSGEIPQSDHLYKFTPVRSKTEQIQLVM
jgi:hypothetical protein